MVEKKVTELPSGPLYWRLENLPTLAQAQGAAGPTSFAAEVAGKVWLFTLAPKEGATPGGTKVVEIGPLPPISASEYLLRVNRAGGAPGAKTPIHTHPAPEAFYMLSGKLGQKTPHGVAFAEAGATLARYHSSRSIGQNGEHNRRSRARPRAWDASTLMSELGPACVETR